MKHVAEVAGVSIGTVSRYLNGRHWVSPHAQEAIAAAIERTGYTVNETARSLVTGRTNSVAYLLTETSQMLFADPTYALLLRGIAVEMARRGLTLVVLVAGTDEERENVNRYLKSGHCDGVMLISPHEHDPLVTDLLNRGVPMVSSGIPMGNQDRAHVVTIDEADGARLATEHLLGLGRQHIAMITGPSDTPGGRYRRDGFVAAMGERLEEDLVVEGDYRTATGQRLMAELLERRGDVDAVFAASDAMAVGAVKAIQESGRRVPEDVAVVGFDDSGLAADAEVPLTTVRQPWEGLVEELVRLMLAAIDDAAPTTVRLPTTLTVRESA